jgi:hypothetical protein
MRALTGTGLHFTTLPEISTNDVTIRGYPGAQSADYIDVPQLQRQVSHAFYGTSMIPASASQVTVDVYNGSAANGLAGDVSQDLAAMGYKAGAVADSSAQSQKVQSGTEVFYGSGGAAQANATDIANFMGVQAPTALSSLPAGHVEVLLGSQVMEQAPGLEMFAADSVNATDYVTAAEQNGQSVSAGAQAAANVGSESDVPAYSESKASSSSSGSSSSPAASPSGSGSGSSGSSEKSSPGSAKKPSGAGSTPNPNPPYGLTSCPY